MNMNEHMKLKYRSMRPKERQEPSPKGVGLGCGYGQAPDGGPVKQIADWYRNRPKKVIRPVLTVVERVESRLWREQRIKESQVQPISLEGTFISRLVPSAQGTTLVLGFADFELQGRAYGVNLISKNPIATAAGDHGTHQFIGRRCRVTIEVLD